MKIVHLIRESVVAQKRPSPPKGGEEIPVGIYNRFTKLREFSISGLKILYTNADQFPNKREELLMFIGGKEIDVIMITEMIPKAQKTQ